MREFFSYFAQGLFFLVIAYFALYVLLELRVLLISRRVERRRLAEISATTTADLAGFAPMVSVLLPICNESSVVERLIDAACRLRYPAGRIEILVLDDSSDITSSMALVKVAEHAVAGVNIHYIRREERSGYKAGNLVNGMRQATGEFFAIFDADFVPPEDFLLRTIHCFQDPQLGFLQTGIDYENRDVSFLTRFQAMEMGHQQYVTVGLSEDGDIASLSGSSCVWRRSCIEAVGGLNASMVTEDVDLGYKAQFGDWKYAFMRDVVSMSILPETISAFRVQRERWGRGLIHSSFVHAGAMLRQRMPLMKRLHAISVMFSSWLLAAIYVLVLLSLPMAFLSEFDDAPWFNWVLLGFFGLVTLWAAQNSVGSDGAAGGGQRSRGWLVHWDNYRYVAMFLPMSLYYFVGGIRAMFGVYGSFYRTPKGTDEQSCRRPRINSVLIAAELFTFFYSLVAIVAAVCEKSYFLIPLNVTVCLGFGMALYWSWQERFVRECR